MTQRSSQCDREAQECSHSDTAEQSVRHDAQECSHSDTAEQSVRRRCTGVQSQ